MVMWASVGVRGSNLCWKGLSPHPLPRWLWGWVHLRKTNITTQKKTASITPVYTGKYLLTLIVLSGRMCVFFRNFTWSSVTFNVLYFTFKKSLKNIEYLHRLKVC